MNDLRKLTVRRFEDTLVIHKFATPFGNMVMNFPSGTQVRLGFDLITINGAKIYGAVYLTLIDNIFVVYKPWLDCILSRADYITKDVSDAAKRKIIDTLTVVVNKWSKSETSQAILDFAEEVRKDNNIRSLQVQANDMIEGLQDKLDELNKAIKQ